MITTLKRDALLHKAIPWNVPIPSVEVLGTSWTDPQTGVTDPSYKWPTVLGQMLGLDEQRVTNIGVNGGQAIGAGYFGGAGRALQDRRMQPDMATASGKYMSIGGVKFVGFAFNDYTVMGGDTANNRTAVEHGLAAQYAASRRARDILRGSFTTGGGTWTFLADTGVSMGDGMMYTQTNATWFEFSTDSTYNSEGITVMLPIINGTTGGTITFIDNTGGGSIALGTYDQNADAVAMAAAAQSASGGLGGFRIPKGTLAAGVRTIRGTVSGLTGANYAIFTGACIDGDAPIFVDGLPHRKNATINYDTQMTWANTRNTTAIGTNGANFHNVRMVDLNPYLTPGWNGTINSSTDEKLWVSTSDIHLNDAGDAKHALAHYDAVQTNVTKAMAADMRYRKGTGLQQHLNQTHSFIADGTIVAGDAVIQSTTDGRVITTTTANSGLIIGVAIHSAIINTPVEVALAGCIIKVNKTAPALATRGSLVGTSTTAGKVAIATPGHGTILGKTLQTAAINTTEVYVLVQLS